MIKLKKYNKSQVDLINDLSQMHIFIDDAFSIRNSTEIPTGSKIIELFKILLSYMAFRKHQLLTIGISKKDTDYIVKQELTYLNQILTEFKKCDLEK